MRERGRWGMEKHLPKIEIVVRLSVAFVLSLAACLVGFDSQTANFAYFSKKATFRSLQSLEIGMYIDVVAAAYNMIQLGAIWFRLRQPKAPRSSIYTAWICYFFDQTAAYGVLAGTAAAAEGSLMVLWGSKEFQWMKWCNKFSRFCFQAGSSILCSFVAAALMAFLSSLSAFSLFRFYSPSRFLLFKPS